MIVISQINNDAVVLFTNGTIAMLNNCTLQNNEITTTYGLTNTNDMFVIDGSQLIVSSRN